MLVKYIAILSFLFSLSITQGRLTFVDRQSDVQESSLYELEAEGEKFSSLFTTLPEVEFPSECRFLDLVSLFTPQYIERLSVQYLNRPPPKIA